MLQNEHLKSTSDTLLPVVKNLFNSVFETCSIPEIWTTGIIKPPIKNKGSPTDPSNYRPITFLSCVGKLFTAVINTRLENYVTVKNIIKNSQAGFKKDFSTIDNIFILHNLTDIVCKSKKKRFCSFIDLKQAFDKI